MEPTPRNTAPAIGLAASYVQRINPDAILIARKDKFQDVKKLIDELKKRG